MQTEVSAGGVIVRQRGRSWNVLLLKDMKGNWTFPKGLVEAGESKEDAARREVKEEVGIADLTLIAHLRPIKYMYYRGELIKKTVYYYLFRYQGRDKPRVQKEEGITEAKWISLVKATDMVGYPKTNKPLIAEAINILESNEYGTKARS